MSNSFNISVKPEIASAVVKIDALKAVADLIHGTDYPALDSKITTLDTVVDLIRSEDVLNIRIDLNTNETKIDVLDGILDTLLVRSAGTPKMAEAHGPGDTLVNVINIPSGSGYLTGIFCGIYGTAGSGAYIKVIIDGVTLYDGSTPHIWDSVAEQCAGNVSFRHRFNTSLQVQHKTTGGSEGLVTFVTYTLEE